MSPPASIALPLPFVKFGMWRTEAADYHARASAARLMSLQEAVPDDREEQTDTTVDLLTRAQAGDQRAIDVLFERLLPPLRRWARGRLPAYARDLSDTQDLIQETVMHALQRLHAFEYRHQGALQAYLRQAVNNRILDEIRRVHRRPVAVELEDNRADPAPSPLQHAIGREGLERYEEALQRLRPTDREAIVARLELQQSYDEIAVALQKATANAARVAVIRAVRRLLRELDRLDAAPASPSPGVDR